MSRLSADQTKDFERELFTKMLCKRRAKLGVSKECNLGRREQRAVQIAQASGERICDDLTASGGAFQFGCRKTRRRVDVKSYGQ